MIGPVACSARKLQARAPARELYQGALFKKQVAWLEARGLQWAILSAKHGLVQPAEMIDPYDLVLKDLSVANRRAWAARTDAQLRQTYPGQTFQALLGAPYREALRGLPFRCPTEHLRIGKQLAFFGALL